MPSLRALLLFAIVVVAILPAVAQAPSVDHMVAAYSGAPWFKISDDKGAGYVCIAQADSDHVDRVVSMLAERAKAQCL